MGQLVFQATLGGQVNLVGPNTASTFNLSVPATTSTLATTSGTETLTNKTLTAPTLTSPNITTALTLTGASGTSGQVLTSAGTGAAPTWTTVAAGTGDVVGPASATANGIALFNSTTGKLIKDSAASDGFIYNVRVGRGAGAVSTNTVVGASAGAGTGADNTAVGSFVLALNDTGYLNVGVGGGGNFTDSALRNNTTGYQNTAVGVGACRSNVGGALNSAFGKSALQNNVSGGSNVAVGVETLASNSASNNTAVGYQAGTNISSGANNACFGHIAGTDTVRNITTNSNEIVMGNNSHTAAYIKIAWTVTSDSRDKTSFAPVQHGLAFINSLTPTAYQFRVSREDDTPTGVVRYGFKAQDILAVEGANPVIIDNSDPDNLKYNQDSMIAVLVNAIKELNAKVQALEALIDGE